MTTDVINGVVFGILVATATLELHAMIKNTIDMSEKDKELLLKDLCARLPYGVKIHINSCIEEQNQMRLFDVNLEGETIGVGNEKWAFRAIPIIDDEDEAKVVKPYLRPMSSMTEEELHEVQEILGKCVEIREDFILSVDSSINSFSFLELQAVFNWLNTHHFDYIGLIKRCLALEAPEGMY